MVLLSVYRKRKGNNHTFDVNRDKGAVHTARDVNIPDDLPRMFTSRTLVATYGTDMLMLCATFVPEFLSTSLG